MWPQIAAAGISAVGSILGGNSQKKAAEQAARVQQQAVQQGIEEQRNMLGTARGDLQPYASFGQEQLPNLQNLLTAQGQADYLQNNPLFQNSLGLVNEQSAAMAAARGRGGSGGFANELMRNYLNTALPFLSNQQNMVFNAAGMGQNAAAGMGNAALQTGQNIAQMMGAGGNAGAAGIIGGANAKSDMFSGIANAAGMGLSAFGQPMTTPPINGADKYGTGQYSSLAQVYGAK